MEFEGFNSDDFCFFIDMPKGYKRKIRKKIENFGNIVYKDLNDNIQDSYKVHKSNALKDGIKKAWYSIGKAYQDRSQFQLCGMTIYIQVNRLGFNSIARGGSFRDNKPIGMLYNKISRDPESFMQLLRSYGKNYFLKFFRRIPLRGDQIKPGLEKWETFLEIRLDKINFDFIEYILAVLEQNKLPGIQICTGIEPGQDILENPEKLVKKSVVILGKLYKFLDFMES